MAWQDWAALGSSLYGAYSTNKAADNAAKQSLETSKIAVDMAKFTPYGVTTGFGTSYFDEDTQTAGYQLDPALAAYRDKLMMMGAETLPGELDPETRAQAYYDETQAMLAPQRAQEQQQLQQSLFGSGRLGMRLSGAAAGGGTNTGMVQPDVLGYQAAQELANQQLAQQARAQSMAELDAAINRGTGLFTSGFGVEQLGMTPLSLGAELGGRATTAGATQAQALLSGGQMAAQANLAGALGTANTLGSLGTNLLKYNQ